MNGFRLRRGTAARARVGRAQDVEVPPGTREQGDEGLRREADEAKHTAEGDAEAGLLSGKQGRVQQLMRKLAVKLNKENHAEEGR